MLITPVDLGFVAASVPSTRSWRAGPVGGGGGVIGGLVIELGWKRSP